jgi:pyruvate oxidase/acetolactate synthase-1/2/3 large subunit
VVSLLGNSAVLIPKLTEKVAQRDNKDYLAEISRLKQNWLAQIEKEADPTAKPIRPPYVIKVLNEKIADNAVITLDVGENCWWFGRNFNMKKTQKLAMSGNLATMGFGLPAALAAKRDVPKRICSQRRFRLEIADGSLRVAQSQRQMPLLHQRG